MLLSVDKKRNEKIEKKTNIRAVATTAKEGFWDYSSSEQVLKCRIDDKNQVNVLFIHRFKQKDMNELVEILDNCTFSFDDNDYPIVVINDFNEGGSIPLTGIFQEFLQPDMTARMFLSFKNDEIIHKAIKGYVEAGAYQNPATGKTFTSVEELMEGAEVDDFGNGVTHSRSKPLFLYYPVIRIVMDEDKPKLKRNRKPTDIIVFTDSFSFSAGGIFTKGLKEAGAAIIVGYNGYPGSKKESFDIGQAPANNWNENLSLLGEDEYNRLNEKGITYQTITVGETYRIADVENGVKPLVPREFLVDAPDERVAIYSGYDDSKYDVFIEAAKGILEKYKTQCNPDNLGLHMRTVLCDAQISKAHMHGGYVCGADGKWSTQCEGYYCDDGYYFNTKTKECEVDPFYNTHESSFSSSSTSSSNSSSLLSSMDSSTTTTTSIWALLIVLVFALF